MKNIIHKFFISMLFLSVLCPAFSQINYWGDVDKFVEEQTKRSFSLINETLNQNAPALEEPLARKAALMNLDAILHDPRNDNSPALPQFIQTRMALILKELNKPVEEGVKIYKLYNHSFIAQTKSVVVAFDLFRGGKGDNPYILNEQMQKIVDKCDIMFLTHNHSDHCDPVVIEMFLNAGKKVIATTGILANKNYSLQYMRSDNIIKETIDLQKGSKLEVTIFPGHQSNLLNNVYTVKSPEGYNITYVGDQYSNDDFEWIDVAKEHATTDVLLINCWTIDPVRVVKGFDPKLVIPGHENEMNHSIDHREAHWLTYSRFERVNRNKLFMTWGEYYHYKK
ncbi:MBL fold metallo-hydrolase [Parabacteroides sp. OttesenSCG-928-G07]|nr:MBL fold metallo-hydrolase [Parabacteroides sp. OttesenSCG-928-G21]MDL2279023.1 MBL fold metallo-hydrolase [Parabacteroides sp. OttesenSCG-928-G07]